MKVVHFVLSESFAGIEQHVDELISHNINQSSKNNNKLSNKLILICNNSIAHYFNKNIEMYSIKNIGRRSIYGKYKLSKLLKQINPDIIHTHGSKTTSIINSINRNKFKHVATVHGIKKNKKVYEKADLVIGVSNKAIDGINNNTTVITNWWHPKLNKIDFGIKEFVLAVGRLEKVKGFDLLISSWKNIQSNLLIVGSGREKSSLLKLIDEENLSNKIKIIDDVKRDELQKFYKKASLLIISSRDEGGPRVALEALYLGVPVISTNVGHMDQILPNELLAKKDSLDSLKRLIERYVDNINDINQEAVFQFIEDEFSIQAKVSEIIDAYQTITVDSEVDNID